MIHRRGQRHHAIEAAPAMSRFAAGHAAIGCRPDDRPTGLAAQRSKTHSTSDRGSRPEDEWELIKMVKNPDVTVRMRGVMEKCSFCLQRIEQAKIAQKIKATNSGDMGNIEVPEGGVQTACQQACPAEAITFGNIKDPEKVAAKIAAQRTYARTALITLLPARIQSLSRKRSLIRARILLQKLIERVNAQRLERHVQFQRQQAQCTPALGIDTRQNALDLGGLSHL